LAPTGSTALHAPAGAAPLEARGVTRRFGGQIVLDGLDMTLVAGETVLVEGQNGAGKTTLLRIAAGLLAPDQGRIRAFGLDPLRQRREYGRQIGLLSAGDRGLYARLSVRQNLEFFAALALVPRRRRDQAVGHALARFSLEPMSERRVDRLSSGQRQRVRLASILTHQPGVILLDEPASSLDRDGLEHLAAALEDATVRGGAVLWCAPSGPRAELPVDRRYVLAGGRLRAA
jgi:ABC-2 type transport system ATP-binding protein